jgi:hypothetical protein
VLGMVGLTVVGLLSGRSANPNVMARCIKTMSRSSAVPCLACLSLPY